jgi:hypothetical protein
VREADLDRIGLAYGQPGVARQALARPQRETQARLQIEEGDRAVLELLADDAFGAQAEAVTIEADRALQVADAQRDQGYPGSYGALLTFTAMQNTRVPPACYLILAWCKDVRNRDQCKASEQLHDWIPSGR